MLPNITDRLRHLVAASPLPLATIIANYTQLGGSRNHLYQVRVGMKADPSIGTVQRILAALDLPWSALEEGPATG